MSKEPTIAYITSNPFGRYFKLVHKGCIEAGLTPCALIIALPLNRVWQEFKLHRLSVYDQFIWSKLKKVIKENSKQELRIVDEGVEKEVGGVVDMLPRRYYTLGINTKRSVTLIKSLGIEYLINAGVSGLFKRCLVEIEGLKIVNGHIGDLPKYRNRNAVWWAIYNKYPLIATVHQINTGVDTGPIWLKEDIPIDESMTLDDIWDFSHDYCAKLIGKAVHRHLNKEITPYDQPTGGFSCYVMHPLLKELLENRHSKPDIPY